MAAITLSASAGPPVIRWGGSDGPNSVSPARRLPADPTAVKPIWELSLGSHQYAVPTIDRGRIYVGANDLGVRRNGYKPTGGGLLLCIEQATGRMIWQFITPRFFGGIKPPYHYNQWKCGVCSSPLVDGERVYIIGGRGEVLCLDRNGQADGNAGPFSDELAYMGLAEVPGAALQPTDGDIVWRFDLVGELGVVPHDVCGSTLAMVGDLLFACTSNGLDDRHDKIPAPQAPALIVLDKRTGRLVARENEGISSRLLHGHWSSPVAARIAGQTLVFFGGGDGVMYAFAPPDAGSQDKVQSLRKVWSADCNPADYRERDGKPIPYSRHNRKSPEGPSEIISTPIVLDGRLYVAIGQSPIHGEGRGCLSCIDAATGKLLWRSTLVGRTLATPAVADGLLYIPDYSGNLHCFDADTGQRQWVHPMNGRAWPASAFVADSKVYASTESGLVWVLRAGRQLEVLSRGRQGSPPIAPVAVDGVLYLPTQKSLLAIPGPAAPAPTPAPDPTPAAAGDESGTVPASANRPIAPTTQPAMAGRLDRFQTQSVAFDWQMQPRLVSGSFRVFDLQFPSPVITQTPANNTVHCEYYRPAGAGRAPAVLVLDIMDGSMRVARLAAGRIASSGCHALIVQMPYYGPRRPADKRWLMDQVNEKPGLLVDAITQGVKDIRRAAAWLAVRPDVDPARIGICGISMGGFAAALTAGVDGRFPRVAILLAGGDLAAVLTGSAREVRPFRDAVAKRGWSDQQLHDFLAPIDPLTYAARLRSANVLMLSARNDEIVPASAASALARAANATIVWYDATHYSMLLHLLDVMDRLGNHFAPANWTANR